MYVCICRHRTSSLDFIVEDSDLSSDVSGKQSRSRTHTRTNKAQTDTDVNGLPGLALFRDFRHQTKEMKERTAKVTSELLSHDHHSRSHKSKKKQKQK